MGKNVITDLLNLKNTSIKFARNNLIIVLISELCELSKKQEE